MAKKAKRDGRTVIHTYIHTDFCLDTGCPTYILNEYRMSHLYSAWIQDIPFIFCLDTGCPTYILNEYRMSHYCEQCTVATPSFDVKTKRKPYKTCWGKKLKIKVQGKYLTGEEKNCIDEGQSLVRLVRSKRCTTCRTWTPWTSPASRMPTSTRTYSIRYR